MCVWRCWRWRGFVLGCVRGKATAAVAVAVDDAVRHCNQRDDMQVVCTGLCHLFGAVAVGDVVRRSRHHSAYLAEDRPSPHQRDDATLSVLHLHAISLVPPPTWPETVQATAVVTVPTAASPCSEPTRAAMPRAAEHACMEPAVRSSCCRPLDMTPVETPAGVGGGVGARQSGSRVGARRLSVRRASSGIARPPGRAWPPTRLSFS